MHARNFFIKAVLFIGLIFAGFPSQAQTVPDKLYMELVSLSKLMDKDFKFKTLRQIYPQTSAFDPMNTKPSKDVELLFNRLKAGEPDAEAEIDAYLVRNLPLPEVHTLMIKKYEELQMPDKVKYHEWMARGLIQALLQTGNGLSSQTPIVVLNKDEELMAASFLGIQVTNDSPESKVDENSPPPAQLGQERTQQFDTRVLDLFKGRDGFTGQLVDLWFDVTDMTFKYNDQVAPQ